MSKRKHSLIKVTVLFLLSPQLIALPGDEIKGGLPSDLIFKKPKSQIQDIRFVLHEQEDLRLLFCEPVALTDRIKRSVCVFDLVGLPLGKNNSAVTTKEIALQRKASVAQVLQKAGMSNWRGGRPQLRIITKNGILQSPLFRRNEDPQSAGAFLNFEVSPGDFVILVSVN